MRPTRASSSYYSGFAFDGDYWEGHIEDISDSKKEGCTYPALEGILRSFVQTVDLVELTFAARAVTVYRPRGVKLDI